MKCKSQNLTDRQKNNLCLIPNRIDTLTSIRFIMILTIAINHLEFFEGDNPNFYSMHFHNAGMGVDYFFLLSGFGLTLSHYKKDITALFNGKYSLISAYQYAKNKVGKLWLWYILTMSIGVPLSLYSMVKCHGVILGFCVTVIQALIGATLTQSAFCTMTLSHAFNGVCWFLSTLFLLYIIYPLLERWNDSIKASNKKIVCYITADLIMLSLLHIIFENIEYFFSIHGLDQLNDLAYGSPYIRIFDFALGILICDLFVSRYNKPIKNATSSEIILTIIFFAWYFGRNGIFADLPSEFSYIVDVVISAFILYVFAFQSGFVSRLLQSKAMVKLGDLSMYIFLFHYAIRINLVPIVGHFIGESTVLNWIYVVIIILGTIVMTAFASNIDQKKKLKTQ